jgi:hypothetical protein
MLEYFCFQIDYCEDFVEEDTKKLSEQISYFEFYLDIENAIDY